jgi:hypothetical protein
MMRSAAVAILVATACCSHPKGPAMSKSECVLAIEGFASQEPARLRALPEACTLEDAQQVLESTKAITPTSLGTGDDPVRLHFFKSEKFKSIRVWLDKLGHVILVDAKFPPAPTEQYFQILGEPDAHLDYPWRSSVIPGGEHVWLSRGVTLASNTKGVLHIGIFRAGLTLEEYAKSVRYVPDVNVDEG